MRIQNSHWTAQTLFVLSFIAFFNFLVYGVRSFISADGVIAELLDESITVVYLSINLLNAIKDLRLKNNMHRFQFESFEWSIS